MSEVDQHESATATARPPAETIEHALRAAVDMLGPESFYIGDVLKSFLNRRCPEAQNDIGLLLIGLEEEIPQSLLGLRSAESLDLLSQVLQQRLSNRRSLNRYAAAWIVKVWSDALRLPRAQAAATTAPEPRTKPNPVAIPKDTAPESLAGPVRAPSPVTSPITSAQSAVRGPLIAQSSPTRWYQIGIAIAAMIVISFTILFESRWSKTQPAAPPVESAPASTLQVMPAPPVEVAGAPARPAVPVAEIVEVGSNEPLVGDGRQHALFAALKEPRQDLASIESRFVGGDAALWSRPVVIDLSKGSGEAGRVPAGTIGLRTTHELKATFEYIVTTSDGKRSAPFGKQLIVAPVAATAPAITDVAIQTPVVSGKPFDVTLAIRDEDRQLASVERTLVGDDGKPRAKVIPASTLKQSGNSVIVPIVASWNGSSATIELTLVGADGIRSETKRVVFDVVQPAAAVASSAVAAPLVAAPAGVSPNCTRTTCGSVVSVHEMDGRSTSRPNYEIIVRTDDRAIHTFRQPTMLRAGARARVVDGRLLVMNVPSPSPSPSRPVPREGRLVPESEPIFSP